MSDGGTEGLWIGDAAGSDARRMVDCVAPCLYLDDPDWSPDARRVVFEHVHQTGRSQDAEIDAVTLSIVLMSGADQRVRGSTDPALFAATADWSPDGKLIVYSALPTARAEAPDLFTLRARGGTPTRLTRPARTGGFAAEPGFDPDGSRVAFSGRETPDDGLLLSVPTTGGRVREAIPGVQVLGRHPRVRP